MTFMFANARRWDARHRTHLENRTEQYRKRCLCSRFATWMCACSCVRVTLFVRGMKPLSMFAVRTLLRSNQQHEKLFETYQSVCDVFFNVIRFRCCCCFAYSFRLRLIFFFASFLFGFRTHHWICYLHSSTIHSSVRSVLCLCRWYAH